MWRWMMLKLRQALRLTERLFLFDLVYQTEKKHHKEHKDKEEIVIPLEDLSPIAQPLAQKKLLKKLHKTIKKGAHIRFS